MVCKTGSVTARRVRVSVSARVWGPAGARSTVNSLQTGKQPAAVFTDLHKQFDGEQGSRIHVT